MQETKTKKRSKQEGQTKVTKWKKKGVSRKQSSTTELKRVRQLAKNATEGKKYECESKSLYGREEKIQEREKIFKVKRSTTVGAKILKGGQFWQETQRVEENQKEQ